MYSLSVIIETGNVIHTLGARMMNNAGNVLYTIMEWITRFAYVQLLWIFFSLIGGIFLGFFPSTVAMFAIMRDWLKGKTEQPLFKTYLSYYKKDFWKSNLFGMLLMGVVLLIGADIWFVRFYGNILPTWTFSPLFAFILLFTIYLCYLFPAFVHYDLNLGRLFKNAFLIMLIHPLHSLLMAVCFLSLYFVMDFLPALAFLFGAPSTAFITMWLCLHAFDRIQKKQRV